MEDKKKQICPFGMTKEDSGTDTQFITSRRIEVWRDKGGTEAVSPQLLQTRQPQNKVPVWAASGCNKN